MASSRAAAKAASEVATRDISPMMQRFRNFLLGRDAKVAVRFSKDVATRSPPEANLPEGPAHKPAFNYYYARDARREVEKPAVLADNTKEAARKALESGEAAPTAVATGAKRRTPGSVYKYSQ